MIAYELCRLCKLVVYFSKRLENNKTQLVCQILSIHTNTYTQCITHIYYIVRAHCVYVYSCIYVFTYVYTREYCAPKNIIYTMYIIYVYIVYFH